MFATFDSDSLILPRSSLGYHTNNKYPKDDRGRINELESKVENIFFSFITLTIIFYSKVSTIRFFSILKDRVKVLLTWLIILRFEYFVFLIIIMM